jgi:hypothetical protein
MRARSKAARSQGSCGFDARYVLLVGEAGLVDPAALLHHPFAARVQVARQDRVAHDERGVLAVDAARVRGVAELDDQQRIQRVAAQHQRHDGPLERGAIVDQSTECAVVVVALAHEYGDAQLVGDPLLRT